MLLSGLTTALFARGRRSGVPVTEQKGRKVEEKEGVTGNAKLLLERKPKSTKTEKNLQVKRRGKTEKQSEVELISE